MNVLTYPYPSRRNTVMAKRGMVATGNPQAAAAGLYMLQQGGNAVDAVVAMAAALTVVEPCCNGLGGDAFGLVHDGQKIYGLNASGPASQALDGEALRRQGYTEMPLHGWTSVNVPGMVGGWMALHERFGSLSLAEVLAPAIDYARHGMVVEPQAAINWKEDWKLKEEWMEEPLFAPFRALFTKDGKPYEAGDVFVSEDMARTLESIVATKGESFYCGELARKIAAYARETGGLLTEADLAAYKPEWVEPLAVDYRGYQVWEMPPNGHGLTVLLALALLAKDEPKPKRDAIAVHRQIEAIKLAFADAMGHITDPEHMRIKAEDLLSPDYIEARRELITDQAQVPAAGDPRTPGTVYLTAADASGLMVSWIQSSYTNFGSCIVVPGTGIALHNRGCNFSLDPEHVNFARGGVRPYHTIIPGMITKDGKPKATIGVMGAFMQPQGQLQVIQHLLDYDENPQAALDAWRWQWRGNNEVELEPEAPLAIYELLKRRGHDVTYVDEVHHMGRGQIIWRQDDGVFVGGTEKRTDGAVLGY